MPTNLAIDDEPMNSYDLPYSIKGDSIFVTCNNQ